MVNEIYSPPPPPDCVSPIISSHQHQKEAQSLVGIYYMQDMFNHKSCVAGIPISISFNNEIFVLFVIYDDMQEHFSIIKILNVSSIF